VNPVEAPLLELLLCAWPAPLLVPQSPPELPPAPEPLLAPTLRPPPELPPAPVLLLLVLPLTPELLLVPM
jgi:hypothetical protein